MASGVKSQMDIFANLFIFDYLSSLSPLSRLTVTIDDGDPVLLASSDVGVVTKVFLYCAD